MGVCVPACSSVMTNNKCTKWFYCNFHFLRCSSSTGHNFTNTELITTNEDLISSVFVKFGGVKIPVNILLRFMMRRIAKKSKRLFSRVGVTFLRCIYI